MGNPATSNQQAKFSRGVVEGGCREARVVGRHERLRVLDGGTFGRGSGSGKWMVALLHPVVPNGISFDDSSFSRSRRGEGVGTGKGRGSGSGKWMVALLH